MRRKVFLLTFLVTCLSLSAQRFNGFIHSDFSGILGARTQPASIAGSPYKFDINLLNANFFITNNFAQLVNQDERTVIRRYIDDKQKFVEGGFSLGGFSLMLTLPQQEAIGLQYQVRGHASGIDISPQFISQVNRFTDLRFLNTTVEDQSGEVAAALWRELSFTYARVLKDDGFNRWKIGVTAKMINSYGGAFAELEELDYSINGQGLARFDTIRMKYSYSSNLDPYEGFDGTQKLDGLPPRNAFSPAFDLGVTFERRASRPSPKTEKGTRRESDLDYEFRISVSITDLGVMEFGQGEASNEILGILPGMNTNINLDDLINGVTSFRTLNDRLATFVEAQPLDGQFKISLPTALNLNYDYNFGNDWFINANAVVDISSLMPADYRLRYLHNVTVTPRWEQSRRAVYLPMYYNQIGDFYLGAAARIGILTIGTQNLGSLFASERDSFGFFFSLNLNQLVANSKKPYCFGTGRGSGMTRTQRTPLYKRKKFIFF